MEMIRFQLADDERDIFLADVDEHLRALEAGILQLEHHPQRQTFDSLFRSAHTLKALAGMIGHDRMSQLLHTLETLLDGLCHERISFSQHIADDLLQSIDVLTHLRNEVVRGVRSNAPIEALNETLKSYLTPKQPDSQKQQLPQISNEQRRMLRLAHEAGKNVLQLEIVVLAEAPAPAALLFQAAHILNQLGQQIVEAPELKALTPATRVYWALIASSYTADAIHEQLAEIPHLDISIHHYTIEPEAEYYHQPQNTPDNTVRMSVERLDALMQLVDCLLTERAQLNRISGTLAQSFAESSEVLALAEVNRQIGTTLNQLQTELMRARMQPLANLFNSFPRLVRDTARQLQKEVDLHISGGDTELDRNVIESLHEPLLHLIRNAIDHGIEQPAERIARNKPPAGRISIDAAFHDGTIVISLEDDGGGINAYKVATSAIERGMISQAECIKLSEQEIIDMIFWPQLSTMNRITELSGRGVGLDVVRTQIEQLNGSIEVRSKLGQGTVFTLMVPHTLAILSTVLVKLGNTQFAIPLEHIISFQTHQTELVKTVHGVPTILNQDRAIPLFELRELFQDPRMNASPTTDSASLVTVGWGEYQAAWVVDHILGNQDIIAKELSPILGKVPGISGCAMLGDGSITLIVDVPGIMKSLFAQA